MAERAIPQVGGQVDLAAVGMDALVNHFDSCKIKIRRYTEAGHYASPFGSQVLVTKALDRRKAA
jgi:hypothetical protein